MSKYPKADRAEALDRLHKWIKPGDTVYTVCDHVSTSGMRRAIRVVLLSGDGGKITDLHPNHAVSRVLGLSFWKRNGRETDALIVDGCGMDMGYHIVYSLSRSLFPDGFGCIGAGCPSNDHSNGDRDYTLHYPEGVVGIDYRECFTGDNVGDAQWAVGVWGERDTWGKRAFTRHDGGPTLYLFDDEIVAEEPAVQHWHQDGGYALHHRWL